jgi:multidrug efflux system membrane fusion protein
MPLWLQTIGSVTPAQEAIIKTQVPGQLMRIFFTEGQTIKQGEKLALVDARPFEAQVKQYEGQLMRDHALLKTAQTDLERYRTLVEQDAIPRQTYDTQVNLVTQYEGAVEIDRGLLEAAKVNLQYCHILAPFTGTVGLQKVDEGNLVQPSDPAGIVTIAQMNPMEVVFSIPEDRVGEVIQLMEKTAEIPVEAYDRAHKVLLAKGILTATDNKIDPTTGTLQLKGSFDNKDKKLFPNQFVNIALKTGTLHGATLLPKQAIQKGITGTFVYIVQEKDHTAHATPVTLKANDETFAVIEEKNLVGQMVVIEGVDRLSDGATVTLTPSVQESSHPAPTP